MIAVEMHRQRNVGMVGGAKNGTESIVLNGGYPDDRDYGDGVVYTGFGGRRARGRQVKDQEWIGANEGMRVNIAEGLPVRVIRGPKGEPAFAPRTGYRYDGLYTVERAWEQSGEGCRMCRFRLIVVDDTPTAVTDAAPPPPVKTATLDRHDVSATPRWHVASRRCTTTLPVLRCPIGAARRARVRRRRAYPTAGQAARWSRRRTTCCVFARTITSCSITGLVISLTRSRSWTATAGRWGSSRWRQATRSTWAWLAITVPCSGCSTERPNCASSPDAGAPQGHAVLCSPPSGFGARSGARVLYSEGVRELDNVATVPTVRRGPRSTSGSARAHQR